MDPNATLRLIDEGIADNEEEDELVWHCRNLFDWLFQGGFKPDWQAYHQETEYFLSWGKTIVARGAVERWVRGEE